MGRDEWTGPLRRLGPVALVLSAALAWFAWRSSDCTDCLSPENTLTLARACFQRTCDRGLAPIDQTCVRICVADANGRAKGPGRIADNALDDDLRRATERRAYTNSGPPAAARQKPCSPETLRALCRARGGTSCDDERPVAELPVICTEAAE
jgi:hypothetical protein